jgi:general nucleoside transport system permease protein
MASVGSFTANMTSGRGFIAVAAIIFARGRPVPTPIACLAFGAAEIADLLAPGGGQGPHQEGLQQAGARV